MNTENEKTAMGAYSLAASSLEKLNLITLPVEEKKPQVRGFTKWYSASIKRAEVLSNQFSSADLAILTRPSNLLVVDLDSKCSVLYNKIIAEIGQTPLIVVTKKGFHFYYSNPHKMRGGIRLGEYPIDIKAAGKSDYVVAPPSNGYVCTEHCVGSFHDIIEAGLPAPCQSGLLAMFPKHPAAAKPVTTIGPSSSSKRPPKPSGQRLSAFVSGTTLNDGERGDGLFREALRNSSSQARKHGRNAETAERVKLGLISYNLTYCIPPKPENEVKTIAKNAWDNYEMKDKNFYNNARSSELTDVCITPEGMLEALNNPYAFALIHFLVSKHEPESTFPLNREGLSDILDWTEYKVKLAKKHLVEMGFVTQCTEARRSVSAHFKLTPKVRSLVLKVPTVNISNDNIKSCKRLKEKG